MKDTEGEPASHQKSIEAFEGATFNFNLSSNGRIENIKGYEEFKQKFDIFKDAYSNSRDQFNGIPDSSFKEEYFRNIFDKISGVLPDRIVFINSTWLRKDSLEIGEAQDISVKYTLDSINAGTAYIKTTSPVEQRVTALNHSVKMQGTKDGVIEIEAGTGMIKTSSQKSIITGNLKIGGVDVSMKINRRSIIEGIKL